jgi:Kdo2-lipid IVA lauroyltransferase/acyltransferase
MRYRLQYALIRPLVWLLGSMPRPVARGLAIMLAHSVRRLYPRLQRVGDRNLELAYPQMPAAERARILRAVFTSLGRQLAEFCRFPGYTRQNVDQVVEYDGLENYLAAQRRGRGVLFLTAHLGGWELGSFVHSLHGYPLRIVMRPMDNPYLDELVRRYRTLHGNSTFGKQDFARGLLAAAKAGETVGVLMDTNMTPPQGVFVDFFGRPACTASGVARVALRTQAAVVPAFTIWDDRLRKYRIRFDPALELVATGDDDQDALANTAMFTRVIEGYVRQYPEQWLWVHRRWKTRPPGDAAVY